MMNAIFTSMNVKLLADRAPIHSIPRNVPAPGENLRNEFNVIEAIHIRAETMTSLLKGILDFHPPTHWGLNE